MNMHKIFLQSFVALMVCGAAYAAPQDDLFGHKWYFGIINQQALTLSDFGKQKAYFEFMQNNTFIASLGCGEITGTYLLTPPNGLELKIINTTTTSANCQKKFMDLETLFIDLLPKVMVWSLDRHTLYFKVNLDDITSIAIFSEQEPY